MAEIRDNDLEIKNLVDTYTKLSSAAIDELMKKETRMKEQLEKKLEKVRTETIDRLDKLERDGMLLTAKEVENYKLKRQREALNEQLQDQLQILQQVSEINAKEREYETDLLQLKVNIQREINAGNNAAAEQDKLILRQKEYQHKKEALDKQKEENKKDKHSEQNKKDAVLDKKQKRQDEKESQQREGDAYQFGDKFFDAFSEFRKEVNEGNSLKKTSEENLLKATKAMGKAITDGLNAVNNAISAYAKYQTNINARLQGISSYAESVDKLSDVAFSPLIKAEDLYANLGELIGQGIVTNVEQRAFFQTIKDGIAETFDVNADYLKRLIRIQQTDSTAARLGMEGYLNKFLNTFVENTEYLTTTFDTVAQSLLEASALMSADRSAEFEFIVQKWFGTLSGVGLSDTTASNLADAIGKLGSGDVDVLNSEAGVLLTMAASRLGTSIGDLLNGGLNSTSTNDLMRSMVEYLQEIANNSDTNIVKNQLANIFGVTVSDLAAIGNLAAEDIRQAYGAELNYAGMYAELNDQFSELNGRMGISNILDNLFNNLTYQNGMNIASNAGLFATWKITDMIQQATGGINIPYITAMGTGVDLEATVEGLMKLGIVGASTLTQIGDIVEGISSVGDATKLLTKMGVSANTSEVKRGDVSAMMGGKNRKSGMSESSAEAVGQHDSSAYKESALNSAYDETADEVDQKLSEVKDPTLEYLQKEVELKDKLEAIVKNQDSYIDFLQQTLGTATIITSSANVSTQMLSNLENSSQITTMNDSEFDAGDSTNIAWKSTTVLHDEALKYLEEMEFNNGFKKLVDDVGLISQKITGTTSPNVSPSNISGINNGIDYSANPSGGSGSANSGFFN